MPQTFKRTDTNREAVHALVSAFGPREAARRAKIPYGTVITWCKRNSWKRAKIVPANADQPIRNQSAGDALRTALEDCKSTSTVHLAQYTAKAAKQASEAANPLAVARKVRDVAAIHSTLWPSEQMSEIIQGEILFSSESIPNADP